MLNSVPLASGKLFVGFVAALALGILAGSVVPARATTPLGAKIDPRALQQAEADGRAPVIVLLAEQADTSAASRLSTKEERTRYVYEQLRSVADRTQPQMLRWLADRGVEARGLFIVNAVVMEADASTLAALARRPDVGYVELEGSVSIPDPVVDSDSFGFDLDDVLEPQVVERGVKAIKADKVWKMGYTGEGTVVGIIDTGANWMHPALKYNYRGRDKDHDYDWFDPAGGKEAPEDKHSHGTHVTGTAIGEAGARQIGVAPGADWIVCRNMVTGSGDDKWGLECVQWMLAPTKVDGSEPKPELAPDVVNASWGSRPGAQCAGSGSLNSAITRLRDAGILFVAAAGNSGDKCETVCAPGSFDISFTVANYEVRRRKIYASSSRGPVKFYGEEMIKPDIAAPGQDINSSIPPSRYEKKSGTSMASPHVAGAAALLMSARPELRGHPDIVQQMMEDTASELRPDKCGPSGADELNNSAGNGLLDIEAAVEAALTATPPPPPTASPTTAPTDRPSPTPTTGPTLEPPTSTPASHFDIFLPWAARREFLERGR